MINVQYILHFKNNDPTLARLVEQYVQSEHFELPTKTDSKDYVVALYNSIISQQISTQAASAIRGQFNNLVGNVYDPNKILAHSIEDYRAIGLSRQKASYIRSISELTSNGTVKIGHLDSLSDQEVINELVLIKGVGVWTAEMFLMFTLARPDVFSAGDLGLYNAAKKLYNKPDMTKKELMNISNSWSPYRTIASLALWHNSDNTPKNQAYIELCSRL